MSKQADDALVKIEEHRSKLRDSINNAKHLVAETDRHINMHRRAAEKPR